MAHSIKSKVFSFFSHLLAEAVGSVHAITCRHKKVEDYPWQKPSPEDRESAQLLHTHQCDLLTQILPGRSPCPMLNALANHGYLPRDGKDISIPTLVTALLDSINLAPDATIIAGVIALRTSTTGNALTFHLDDLAKHGGKPSCHPSPFPMSTVTQLTSLICLPPVIEHDGSLSRHDIHTPPPLDNNNNDFAPDRWAMVLPLLGRDGDEGDDGTISIETAAKARLAHLAAVKAMEPEFDMADSLRASVIETCLYLLVFGEGTEGRARREWVRVLFGEFLFVVSFIVLRRVGSMACMWDR
jgi:hypothetical protein